MIRILRYNATDRYIDDAFNALKSPRRIDLAIGGCVGGGGGEWPTSVEWYAFNVKAPALQFEVTSFSVCWTHSNRQIEWTRWRYRQIFINKQWQFGIQFGKCVTGFGMKPVSIWMCAFRWKNWGFFFRGNQFHLAKSQISLKWKIVMSWLIFIRANWWNSFRAFSEVKKKKDKITNRKRAIDEDWNEWKYSKFSEGNRNLKFHLHRDSQTHTHTDA